MIDAWILFTCGAALMQAVRTAGQKSLSAALTPMSATLVRYVFGLPLVIAYLLWLTGDALLPSLQAALSNIRFVGFAALASVAQILATALLVAAFGQRNFTVATSFAKTEALQTAAIGTLLFQAGLSAWGWFAVALGVAGVFIIGIPLKGDRWDARGVLFGTLSGTAFALTSLWLREASLALGTGALQSAAMTLLCMITLQSVLCLIWTAAREPGEFRLITARWPLALFVGVTGAAGSIGWFTAMRLQNPALVKSLGQVEVLATIALTVLVFRERISARELLGVAAISLSVLVLLAKG